MELLIPGIHSEYTNLNTSTLQVNLDCPTDAMDADMEAIDASTVIGVIGVSVDDLITEGDITNG